MGLQRARSAPVSTRAATLLGYWSGPIREGSSRNMAPAASYRPVVDADLSRYFDSIPHDDLLKSVARRVAGRFCAAADQVMAEGADRGTGWRASKGLATPP
jgi:hypothetical protein